MIARRIKKAGGFLQAARFRVNYLISRTGTFQMSRA